MPILRMDISPSIEYLIGFNGTSCKMVIIQQPDIKISRKAKVWPFDGQITKFVTQLTGMNEEILSKHSKIRIHVISKAQPLIMNMLEYS